MALVWVTEFDLVADHQALKTIYGPRSKVYARIERWVLRLRPFNYKLCYVPYRENIADALSRLKKIPASRWYVHDDEYVRAITLQSAPVAFRIEEIETALFQDVHECLQSGDWKKAPKAFVMVRNEFNNIGWIVLLGTRIVVLRELPERVVDLAHEGRLGLFRLKRF